MMKRVAEHGSRGARTVVLCLAVSVLGCASDSVSIISAQASENQLDVVDQRGDGRSVEVRRVVLASGGGYAVVYADGGGAPGRRLGASALLSTGTHRNLRVPTATVGPADGILHVVLHLERTSNETLDFPGADRPVDEGGRVLEVKLIYRPK